MHIILVHPHALYKMIYSSCLALALPRAKMRGTENICCTVPSSLFILIVKEVTIIDIDLIFDLYENV